MEFIVSSEILNHENCQNRQRNVKILNKYDQKAIKNMIFSTNRHLSGIQQKTSTSRTRPASLGKTLTRAICLVMNIIAFLIIFSVYTNIRKRNIIYNIENNKKEAPNGILKRYSSQRNISESKKQQDLYNQILQDDCLKTKSMDCKYFVKSYVDNDIAEAMYWDKSTGCSLPSLDPFPREIMRHIPITPEIDCDGKPWVECIVDRCQIKPAIIHKYFDAKCMFRNILWESNDLTRLAEPITISSNQLFMLKKSDHVYVTCKGGGPERRVWEGYFGGVREIPRFPGTFPARSKYKIAMLGFDSTSRSAFVRHLETSYEYLKYDLDAIILNGYNIVGDGPTAALLPMLTGWNELELPEVRRDAENTTFMDDFPFIWKVLSKFGYTTAFHEDVYVEALSSRLKGFKKKPTDHYLRTLFKEAWMHQDYRKPYCFGNMPRHHMLLKQTIMFMRRNYHKLYFILTLFEELSQKEYGGVTAMDYDLDDWLKSLETRNLLKDTFLIIFGNHGAKFYPIRNTYYGKMEERLPFMAIIPPESFKIEYPDAVNNLRSNAEVLTTPYDVHATLLDIVNMSEYSNTFSSPGAEFPRSMSLLKQIPRNRSCAEAGVASHWCTCQKWESFSKTTSLVHSMAKSLVRQINNVTLYRRQFCSARTLVRVDFSWILRYNDKMIRYDRALDQDGYIPKYGSATMIGRDFYKLQVILGPENATFEAILSHELRENRFIFNIKDAVKISGSQGTSRCDGAVSITLAKVCHCALSYRQPEL